MEFARHALKGRAGTLSPFLLVGMQTEWRGLAQPSSTTATGKQMARRESNETEGTWVPTTPQSHHTRPEYLPRWLCVTELNYVPLKVIVTFHIHERSQSFIVPHPMVMKNTILQKSKL